MGSNELLITELILKNVLTILQPAGIAALLSALIFQQRTDFEPKIPPNLTNVCISDPSLSSSIKCLKNCTLL